MGESARTLMNMIIDYAGLFPPAKLDLETSLKNYLTYLKSEDRWALSSFVIPVAMLKDFPYDLMESDVNVQFSVLVNPLNSQSEKRDEVAEDVLRNLSKAGEIISKFIVHDRVSVPTLEVRLDHHLFTFGEEFIAFIVDALKEHVEGLGVTRVFFEIPFFGSTEKMFTQLVSVIALDATYPVGVKLRTGGTERHLFPPLHDLSGVIQLCAKHGIAMKATAGLHRPIRYYDEGLDVWRYGFINVFSAMMMASKHNLARQMILEILSETDITNFSFVDGLRWKEFVLTEDDIIALRSQVAISYGSCDFLEPLEYLRELGLLT